MINLQNHLFIEGKTGHKDPLWTNLLGILLLATLWVIIFHSCTRVDKRYQNHYRKAGTENVR